MCTSLCGSSLDRRRHGVGKLSSQGGRYEGEWAEDRQHGKGFVLLDTKDRYAGERGWADRGALLA